MYPPCPVLPCPLLSCPMTPSSYPYSSYRTWSLNISMALSCQQQFLTETTLCSLSMEGNISSLVCVCSVSYMILHRFTFNYCITFYQITLLHDIVSLSRMEYIKMKLIRIDMSRSTQTIVSTPLIFIWQSVLFASNNCVFFNIIALLHFS